MQEFKSKARLFFTLLLFVYSLAWVLFTYSDYSSRKNEILENIDLRLYNSAISLKYILPDDLHDRAIDKDAISIDEDMDLVRKIINLTKDTGLKYAYTLIKQDERLFFIATVVEGAETKRGTYYFYDYTKEADKSFFEAFDRTTPTYQTVSDQWGKVRTVMIPQTSPGGIKYLACADYDIGYVDKLLQKNLLRSITFVIFFVFFSFFIVLIYTRVRSKYYKTLHQYSHIVSNSTDMLALLDQQYKYLAVNKKYAEAFNLPVMGFIGSTVANMIGEKSFDDTVKQNADRCLSGNEVNFQDWFDLPAHGRRYLDISYSPYLDESDVICGYVVTSRDITDRKLADETFQALVRSSTGITGIDYFENICTQLGNVFDSECVIIGELVDSLNVKALAMVLDGKLVENYSYQLPGTPCEHAATKGFCHYPDNICLLFPDDKELQDMGAVGYVGCPLKNQSGTVIGILCIISRKKLSLQESAKDFMGIIAARTSAEIERTKAERDKIDLESQLRHANKMEAIGTMAGGIAHDFNNILAAIIGFAELSKYDIPDSNPALDQIEQVLKAGRRARDLVQHILTFSRMSNNVQGHIVIDLKSLVKEVLKFQRSTIPSTIEILSDFGENIGHINGDPTQIHQVIMNFCTNASHAMEEKGGILTVKLHNLELSDADLINEPNLNAGTYAKLSVNDTGPGMTSEIIDKIFDPYFTTKEVGKGSGMGLAVVHGIAKSHGGFIKVESKLGKGSTFDLFFPAVKDKKRSKEADENEKIPTGTENILFVDDEKMLADIGRSIFEILGYSVTSMTDSSEALKIFKDDPTHFDLVITDYTMPNITGPELAEQLLRIRADIPIILCTGYSNKIEEGKTNNIGIREYVLKPINKSAIAKLVRKVLDGDEAAS